MIYKPDPPIKPSKGSAPLPLPGIPCHIKLSQELWDDFKFASSLSEYFLERALDEIKRDM